MFGGPRGGGVLGLRFSCRLHTADVLPCVFSINISTEMPAVTCTYIRACVFGHRGDTVIHSCCVTAAGGGSMLDGRSVLVRSVVWCACRGRRAPSARKSRLRGSLSLVLVRKTASTGDGSERQRDRRGVRLRQPAVCRLRRGYHQGERDRGEAEVCGRVYARVTGKCFLCRMFPAALRPLFVSGGILECKLQL